MRPQVYANVHWGNDGFVIEWDNEDDGSKVQGRVIVTRLHE